MRAEEHLSLQLAMHPNAYGNLKIFSSLASTNNGSVKGRIPTGFRRTGSVLGKTSSGRRKRIINININNNNKHLLNILPGRILSVLPALSPLILITTLRGRCR